MNSGVIENRFCELVNLWTREPFAKIVYKTKDCRSLSKRPVWNQKFHGRKVLVSRNESQSFKAGNSQGLKSTEKGSSRLPEVLVNNVYFCRKKRAALQSREVLKSGILGKQRAEFLPSGLWLNVREIVSCKLRSSHWTLTIDHWTFFLIVKHVWWYKGTKNSWNYQRKAQIFWYNIE